MVCNGSYTPNIHSIFVLHEKKKDVCDWETRKTKRCCYDSVNAGYGDFIGSAYSANADTFWDRHESHRRQPVIVNRPTCDSRFYIGGNRTNQDAVLAKHFRNQCVCISRELCTSLRKIMELHRRVSEEKSRDQGQRRDDGGLMRSNKKYSLLRHVSSEQWCDCVPG